MNKKEIFPINVIAYKDLQKYIAEFNCNKIINKRSQIWPVDTIKGFQLQCSEIPQV